MIATPKQLEVLIRRAVLLLSLCTCFPVAGQSPKSDEPPVIDPGTIGNPPSDVIVLFNGLDLSQWKSASRGEAKWKVEKDHGNPVHYRNIWVRRL